MIDQLLGDRFHLAYHYESLATSVYALVVCKDGPRIKEANPSNGVNQVKVNGAPGYNGQRGWSMAQLADFIARGFPGNPVVDRTGLNGRYAFEAVEHKLGLKLESRKEPLDYIVIDHLERPTVNLDLHRSTVILTANPREEKPPMKRIALSGLLSLIPLLVVGQPSSAPSFEVASVKLHTFPPGAFGFGPVAGGDGANIRISGNRVTIGPTTFTRLIMAAYKVKDFQISGVPETLGQNQFYDIAAKVEGEGTPTLEQIRPLLQTLLHDRFQLQFHGETRELLVYDLVVSKNGSKLKESSGPRPAPPVAYNGPVIRFDLVDKSIADLIGFVAPHADRPVVDKTRLKGRYDFSLQYARDNPEAASHASDKSIFAAVEDLGLKLTPAKEATEVLVIDYAGRPSGNQMEIEPGPAAQYAI
ncbi:MAG TPA: TIGR03435 family protein [Bryobacteraceae bacterium]|nr:TIGR03435 family protein [Bryobacteraceae bacterium]